MISPTELMLTGTRGTLLVTMGDEVKTLEAGSSYRLEVESEDPGPAPNPQTPHPTARNHFLWIAIPVDRRGDRRRNLARSRQPERTGQFELTA